jgi:hypothetical protein
VTSRGSSRREVAPRRSGAPTDWLLFLEQWLPEIRAAAEILRRLRWAVELSKRSLAEAPGPLPGWRAPYRPRRTRGPVERVLLPEEMVARMRLPELEKHLNEWEIEVREWAHGIWERRGETLRLRDRRRRYREGIDSLRNRSHRFGHPDISDAAAARHINQCESRPGVMIPIPGGHGKQGHFHVFTDPFGNPLPPDEEERLLREAEDERIARPLHDKELRRIFKGEHKKSRGGILDIDPRLLRSKK